MKNKKLPIILIVIMAAWVLASVVFMYVDNNFSIEYIFEGIKLGALNNGVILFGMANFYGIKDSLKAKSRNELKYRAKRNIGTLLRFVLVFSIIGVFASCVLLELNDGDFTAANIGFLTLVITVVLCIFTGLLASVKSAIDLKKEYGIGITFFIIIISVLMVLIKYQK